MTAERARRGLVRVGARVVHYRALGSGPVIVALHGSPESAKSLEAVMAALATRFHVIALDTPGNADSDPLPEPAAGAPPLETADFARALLDTLDALRLGRVALYGFHTGAGIANETSLLAPERITAVVLDGYGVWTEAERALFLGPEYLAPFSPSWDGGHLAALWARTEEQSIFFPYHARTDSARLDMDLPPLPALHRRAMDWLMAGDAYRAPYGAAFRRRGEDGLGAVTVPTLLGASPPDPLVAHLGRAAAVSPSVRIERWADRPQAFGAMAAFFAEHPGDPPAPGVGPDVGSGSGVERGFIGGLHVRGSKTGPGRPLLLLHEAGGSSRRFTPIIEALSGRRPVFAIDLPGHGLSDEAPAEIAWSERLSELTGERAPGSIAIAGAGWGARLALALQGAAKTETAGLIGALETSGEAHSDRLAAAPDLAPTWDGAHFLRAWRMLRRQAVFAPWHTPVRAAARSPIGDLDPERMHLDLIDLMRAGPAYRAALEQECVFEASEAHLDRDALTVFAVAGDPRAASGRADRFAAALGCRMERLADETSLAERLAIWRA